MFELEFPLDTLEIINETSLCVSGVQAYSKSCELLQLCVPPKLLHSEDDEGLCKDRDFKILSGGYASGRIRRVRLNNFIVQNKIACFNKERFTIALLFFR